MRSDPLHPTRDPQRRGALGPPLHDYELPSFSGVIVSALSKVRSPHANAGDVAKLLEADPGVSVKLLGLANSACYGLTSPVNSAAHAVTLLGRDQVETLLLTLAVTNVLPKNVIPELDSSRFWCGAARRAVVARGLATHIDRKHGHESFTAGLLQDMALPLLAGLQPEEYGTILTRYREDGLDLAELEREAFGWDHAMVGAWMCQEWRFSSLVMRAIGAHHGVWEETDLPAVTLVGCLTDADTDYGQDTFVEAVCSRYSLPEEDVRELLSSSEESAADMAKLFV